MKTSYYLLKHTLKNQVEPVNLYRREETKSNDLKHVFRGFKLKYKGNNF